ncbi:MAG: hypothetical protein QM788_04130 [Roseateles sp.]|uniref:hypothetical protein n=1 Tax=Roseateles sp. TaxID=1971397 RepID=UPI0039E78212
MTLRPAPHSARRAGRCGGQAAAEYTVVLALVTLVLVVAATEPAAIDQLVAAVKSFFKAFSFALSMPAQHAV